MDPHSDMYAPRFPVHRNTPLKWDYKVNWWSQIRVWLNKTLYLSNIDYLQGDIHVWHVVLPWRQSILVLLLTTSDIESKHETFNILLLNYVKYSSLHCTGFPSMKSCKNIVKPALCIQCLTKFSIHCSVPWVWLLCHNRVRANDLRSIVTERAIRDWSAQVLCSYA